MNQAREPKSFARLIEEEDAQLRAGSGQLVDEAASFDRVIGQPGSAEEPWLAFTNQDRVGLALSGGGIRSATFNLGLLQALRHKGMLEQIDYLSTVSGGGYIGGFWSAWRQHSFEIDPGNGRPLHFPKQTRSNTADGQLDLPQPSPKEIRERPEFRHLREFSRFLMPRVGFMDAETWNGIVAILFGLLPSLVVTLAVIGLGLIAWLFANALLLNLDYRWSAGLMFVLNLWVHLSVERRFWKRKGAEIAEFRAGMWLAIAIVLSLLSALAMGGVCALMETFKVPPAIGPLPRGWVFGPGPINPTWAVFAPVAAWIITAGTLVVTRLLHNRNAHKWDGYGAYTALAMDRGIARCLAIGLVWTTLSGLWLFAIWLMTKEGTWWKQFSTSAGTAAILAGLFAWLRDWLIKPIEPTNLQTFLRRIKPILPQLLAYGAVAALFVLVSQAVLFVAFDAHHASSTRLWGFVAVCAAIVGVALWLFDLANVGLHEFYRSRIARCFLGAANPESLAASAEKNRQTNERKKDDFRLGDIPGPEIGDPVPRVTALYRPLRLRPIHLICCAANHLAGDPLASLYRGARSAVLSRRGITLANETGSLPDLRVSSALTASAAAFNSNMGAVSMNLGLPVAFLMTAINLRLGLWVPHPRNPKRTQRWFPGIFFFLELFGRTQSDSLPPGQSKDPKDLFPPLPSRPRLMFSIGRMSSFAWKALKRWRKRPRAAWRLLKRLSVMLRAPRDSSLYLHLSDGAHFENLGLYELIRRHCRYVIVSDCGADPNYSFDDLANCVRRVREDFGVEIEMDLEPVRPNKEGLAQQHLVAGVIHYDGVTGCDKGTILYFKPVITGNESCDVLQYRTRNSAFPQEGTGDQFYDEAQWESYHRLGEHSGHEAFRFVEELPRKKAQSPESVFHFASERWQPGWPQQNEQFIALTARFSQLEAEIREHAPAFLRAEFFPEVAVYYPPAATATAEEQVRAVYFLMIVLQLMEDAWIACKLDTQWSHPLNEGWMSYMHRWASTPSFHRWWPILKPLYSPGFREFAKRRFALNFKDISGQGTNAPPRSIDTRLQLQSVSIIQARTGFAWREWSRRQNPPIPGSGLLVLSYELLFPSPEGLVPLDPLQIGVALVQLDYNTGIASWTTNHFYVPASLHGAGFIGRFLDALIEYFRPGGMIQELRVTILDAESPMANSQPRPDPASRARRRQLVDFYKSRGFNYDRRSTSQTNEFNQLFRQLP